MLRDQISTVMKEAMRAGDKIRVSTTRLILAALKDKDIEARTRNQGDGITEAEILSMLQSMIKQRQESAKQYKEGGRTELAEQEEAEIKVIQEFMPQPLSDEETEAAISGVIENLQADGIRDMGRVMAALKTDYAGRLDMTVASQKVRALLTA